MVRLHVKCAEKQEFLFETTVAVRVPRGGADAGKQRCESEAAGPVNRSGRPLSAARARYLGVFSRVCWCETGAGKLVWHPAVLGADYQNGWCQRARRRCTAPS